MDNVKTRILYVEESQDGTVGGSHYCMLDLINELDKNKFHSSVMFYEQNSLVSRCRALGAEVTIYEKPKPLSSLKQEGEKSQKIWIRIIRKNKISRMLYNNIMTSFFPLAYFIWFILKNKIDIVHLNNSVFTFYEWVLAVKITFRKIVVHQRSHFKKISPYLKYHHRYYDYILGMSDYTKKYLVENGVDVSKYRTFYDRIDVKKLKGRINRSIEEVRKEFRIDEKDHVIGIVGNIQPWKGQMTVVKAVEIIKKTYPNIKCLLVGDWSPQRIDYVNEIKSFIKENGLQDEITLTGHRADVPELLSCMEIFIHASISPEPFGMVILEAMALKKAIIASNEGGPLEMLKDGKSGYLIEPGNSELLAEKIDKLLSDKKLCKSFGEAAYHTVDEEFSALDMDFVESMYSRLASNQSVQ
jgi:glycosyltransferase involved in cell wall biosynthesis